MRANKNQNIFDIALQEYGTLENVFTLINDNNLTFNSKLEANQELIINNDGVGDNKVKNFVTLQKIKYNNDQEGAVSSAVGGDYLAIDYNSDYLK